MSSSPSTSTDDTHEDNIAINALQPPCKRPRTEAAATPDSRVSQEASGAAMDGSLESMEGVANGGNAFNKLKCSNSSSSGSSTSDDSISGSLQRFLQRKVARRSASSLDETEREVVRLIVQHLHSLGLKTSADVLMHEANCRLEQPSAASFRKHVISGDWNAAIKSLEGLKDHLEKPEHLTEMKYLIIEHKYLECIAQRSSFEALKILQTELSPLEHNRRRTHELSSLLMQSHRPSSRSSDVLDSSSRSHLMERLQNFLPASVMLPPRRLRTLLAQASRWQHDRCLFHIGDTESLDAPDISSLATDHCCFKPNFPTTNIQTLNEHCEEIWHCQFSPDGLKLATGSKDSTVIVWDLDPVTLKFKKGCSLERNNHGVSFLAWSPDSSHLAVCGPEECDEICLWDVLGDRIDGKISHSTEDSLTAVCWSPDGSRIACGGSRGNFYQCDTKGVVLDSWEGIRVQCLQYRADSKNVLAADTHHRIRSYNFEKNRDYTVLQEDHSIMTFTIDPSDTYVLLSIANQGLHMWNIDFKMLVRKFVGVTQGFYTLHSCFGYVEAEQNSSTNDASSSRKMPPRFLASGSEDHRVFIYNTKREEPIAILSGHLRLVNAVTWNPRFPELLVSVSDDCTARVWGPDQLNPSSYSGRHECKCTNGDASNGFVNNVTNGVT